MSNKLTFTKIWCRNFRSVDNMGLSLDYTKSLTTMIGSFENGNGKSNLVLWALYFALFGKPYGKDSSKPSLVNSRNNKDCLVEVEFETKGSKWVVRRGLKPTVFDIIKDGVRVEDEAALRDYQKYLETKVIGIDEKTFCNTIALHKDKFVPFVSMSASERRAYVEQMLDLTIFSNMSDIVKEELKAFKREQDNLDYEERNLKTKIEASERIIQNLQDSLNKKNGQVDSEIQKVQSDIDKTNDLLTKFKEKETSLLNSLSQFNYDKDKHSKTTLLYRQMESKVKEVENRISNVLGMDVCPTCKQHVSKGMKEIINKADADSLKQLKDAYATLMLKDQEYDLIYNDFRQVSEELRTTQESISKLNNIISNNNSMINSLMAMKSVSDEQDKINIEFINKKELETKLNDNTTKQQEILSKIEYHSQLMVMLKDSGVKADVIKQYIPYLNTKINEYLGDMGFNITLELDSEFNVVILSPDRKNQTIGSLSSGQRSRIDLAVLFAWREISSAKSTVDCNLLIMDEILESLSEQGVVDFMEFFKNKFGDKTNLFVITQRRNEFDTYFDDSIIFGMKDDFSYICD